MKDDKLVSPDYHRERRRKTMNTIAQLEQKEILLCEMAYDAYWNGPSWKLQKYEAALAEVRRELRRCS